MKIDQMLLREDFYSIIQNTLKSYYKTVHGLDINLSTDGGFLVADAFIYPKINAITSRAPSHSVKEYIFNEFNSRSGLIKYLQGKIYSALCLYGGGLMASKTLVFGEQKPINKDILIWPCNRKIRIFNFNNGFVDTVLKEGFSKNYFEKEVSFRSNTSYSFIPKINMYGDNWYREELLSGQPLVRKLDNNIFTKSLNETINHIKTIAEDTLKYVNADCYSNKLLNNIEELIEQIKKRKYTSILNEIWAFTLIANKVAKSIKHPVPIVLSHGDLQSGNLWVANNNKTLIMDWETYGYRSIWYDPATLFLSTRSRDGIYKMFENRNKHNVKKAILINDTNKLYNIDGVIGIIILEDIKFKLKESLELPFDWGSESINQFGDQIRKINFK